MENQQQASPAKLGAGEPFEVACEDCDRQPLIAFVRQGSGNSASERVVRVAGGWEVFHPLGDEVTVRSESVGFLVQPL